MDRRGDGGKMSEQKQAYEKNLDKILELSELIKLLSLSNRNLQKRLDEGHEQYIALLGCGGSRRDSVNIKSNRYASDLIVANTDLIQVYKKELATKVSYI